MLNLGIAKGEIPGAVLLIGGRAKSPTSRRTKQDHR